MDDREYELKQAELKLKEREVAAKEKEGKTSKWFNPVTIAIYVAAIGLFGNIYSNYSNNRASEKRQHGNAQSDLVLQVIKTNGDTDDACKNLDFFVNIGFLDDPKGAVHKVCGKKGEGGIPTLPTPGTPTTLRAEASFALNVRVEDADSHEPIEYATVVQLSQLAQFSNVTPPRFSAPTNSNGQVNLDFAFSTDRLVVSKDGYWTTTTKPLGEFIGGGQVLPSMTIQLHRARESKN